MSFIKSYSLLQIAVRMDIITVISGPAEGTATPLQGSWTCTVRRLVTDAQRVGTLKTTLTNTTLSRREWEIKTILDVIWNLIYNSASLTSTEAEVCEDVGQHCDFWKTQGYCSMNMMPYMQRNCRRTCEYCTLDEGWLNFLLAYIISISVMIFG